MLHCTNIVIIAWNDSLNILTRQGLQMSIDYDMMLRTDLIVYSKFVLGPTFPISRSRDIGYQNQIVQMSLKHLNPPPHVTSQRKSIVNHEGTRPSPTPLQTGRL